MTRKYYLAMRNITKALLTYWQFIELLVILMQCPRCKAELTTKPTKEWDYRNKYYHVKAYKCTKCGKNTMLYYKGNKLSFIIPKNNEVKF